MAYVPRGIANKNPTNIRKGPTKWQGEIDGADPNFCTFSDPTYGLRAAMVLFGRYYYVHALRDVTGIISRWAPGTENNTAAYITAVAKQMNVDPNAQLTMDEPTIIALTQAVVCHENGRSFAPYPALWYDDPTYQAAYALTMPANAAS